MELNEWMWRNKVTKRAFAKALGIHHQTAFIIASRKHTPSLFTALAAQKYTKGEVSLFELLSDKDRKKFLEINPLTVDE